MNQTRSTPARRSGARPVAVFIGGAPGSGKTTLASVLAPALGAALLDLDVATGPLTNVVMELVGAHDLGEPRVAGLTRAPRYASLLGLAEDTTRAGTSTVLVAPFGAERDAGPWAAIVARFAPFAAVHLVWLSLAPGELATRLATRAAARDAAKLADPDAYLSGLDTRAPTAPHLLLDATRPPADLVRDVLAFVDR